MFKRLIFNLLVASLLLIGSAATTTATPSVKEFSIQEDQIPLRIIHRVIMKSHKHFGLSIGEAWSEYLKGNLTIVPGSQEGEYIVDYQGECIAISILTDIG